MELATPKLHQTGPNSYDVSHGSDAGLWVEFEMVPVKQEFESNKQGRPVYKDVPFINIHVPGDKTKKVVRPAKLASKGPTDMVPTDPQRFPRQWEAFQSQAEQTQTGTPLTEWAPITKSEALELKALKIHTVEQLASMADTSLSWLGGRTLRDKAKVWLESAKGGAAVSEVVAENDRLRNELEAMKQQIKELASLKTPDEAPARRGRPAKTDINEGE